MKRVLVIGVGGDGRAGLPSALQERIATADELWGSARLLTQWDDMAKKTIPMGANIAEQSATLTERGDRQVVVLASGDPGFYGVASTLLRHLPPAEVEIIPHTSSLQVAFARAGIPWSDAIFTSAHARPLSEVVGWARRTHKLGILTDPEHTPALIARTLLDAGVPNCRAIVAENLGLPDEKLTDTRLNLLPNQSFGPLNVLLLIHEDDWQPTPLFAPRPDDAYAHRHGLITKRDVRMLALGRLALHETDVVWDIGAGSGAVSVEMAELAWRETVYAIEQNNENIRYIQQNMERYSVLNLNLIAGHAPEALANLPAPNAVFIGGTGGEIEAIMQTIDRVAQPGCRVVLNLVVLDNLNRALVYAEQLGWDMAVTQINIAEGQMTAGHMRLAALNPVFILSTTLKGSL